MDLPLSDLVAEVFFFLKIKNYLFIWLCRVLVAACGIFLGRMGSVLAAYRLSCPPGMCDLSSLTGDWTSILCLGRQILSHWTIRGVPGWSLNQRNWGVLIRSPTNGTAWYSCPLERPPPYLAHDFHWWIPSAFPLARGLLPCTHFQNDGPPHSVLLIVCDVAVTID